MTVWLRMVWVLGHCITHTAGQAVCKCLSIFEKNHSPSAFMIRSKMIDIQRKWEILFEMEFSTAC